MYDAKKNEMGAFIAKTVSRFLPAEPVHCIMGNQYCIISKQSILKCFILKTIFLISDCPLTPSQIPAGDIGSSSIYYIDTSTLGLDKDFEFHMFLRACQSNYTVSVTHRQHRHHRRHSPHRQHRQHRQNRHIFKSQIVFQQYHGQQYSSYYFLRRSS